MAPWRILGVSVLALGSMVAVGAVMLSAWLVLPPVVAATAVLASAALSVDYFGLRQRLTDWTGMRRPGPAAWAQLHARQERFARDRARGSVHAAASARALLLALAELDRLRQAGDAVDCLAAEACNRFRDDVCGDALRALALSELGRTAEAARLDRSLGADAASLPVVAWSRARICERRGALSDALAALERAVVRPGTTIAHDLAALRARLQLRIGRADAAEATLRALAVAGGRTWVEDLLTTAPPSLALVARRALGDVAAFR